MSTEVGPASELTPGTVTGAGRWAVGNIEGDRFAVSRRCRHLMADLGDTGRMTRGPQGIFAKIPGLGLAFTALTKVLPLGRGTVVERDGRVVVD